MKKLVSTLLSLTLVTFLGANVAVAAGTAHSKAPKEMDWSFSGPFGTYDKGQLQRGLKVYVEVCAACHSLERIAFRNLVDLGYSEEQVKALAAEYEVLGGPNEEGEMFDRPAILADYFPKPFANVEAAAYSNNGAAPPDLSLMAKARAATRGFPTFVFDIFTMYAEGGPDYIYSLLTGYEEAPHGVEVTEGTHYNPYFMNGISLSMAPPLSDEQVTYDDGSPETLDQYARDVSAFMMWAAEPHMETRKSLGFKVVIFLLIFAGLLYLTKKSIWSRVEH
ncbi:MAG: cytochrome c1 [Rhizobiaceae bacterium]|nr:cytochrome c1 [Rhizobiaceae bacterium]MDF2370091.1 cytochrome c1 [Rhizobiaceae bacterium]|tara:strand:- start:792 stop:1625 length:834 start_codon:yes stop_codon:yes gene_type:complete